MAETGKVATAIGQPLAVGKGRAEATRIRTGQPPVVFQAQTFAYIPLETPEELKQWEEDLRSFYGVTADASALAGRACETCSCCTDDCGLLELE
jgi:2-methylaconitate cis-trans-isomerase PrpF